MNDFSKSVGIIFIIQRLEREILCSKVSVENCLTDIYYKFRKHELFCPRCKRVQETPWPYDVTNANMKVHLDSQRRDELE